MVNNPFINCEQVDKVYATDEMMRFASVELAHSFDVAEKNNFRLDLNDMIY